MTAASAWREAVVAEVLPRTARVTSLFLDDVIGPWQAGQHVDVRLTAEDGYAARRSYSIAAAPGASRIELMIERLDDGEVSPFLHDVVRAGDTVELRGPIGGHFVWTTADGGPLLLVAGGSGIAPLIAMLRYRAAAVTGPPTLLLYGARTWDDLVCRDELLSLAGQDPTLRIVFATSRETSPRLGDFAGRLGPETLHAALARWAERPRYTYVCGSTGFVETVADALLAEGIDAASIRTERYGGVEPRR